MGRCVSQVSVIGRCVKSQVSVMGRCVRVRSVSWGDVLESGQYHGEMCYSNPNP